MVLINHRPVRELHNPFVRLTTRQLTCSDFDAEHPVCLWLADRDGLDREARLWLSFLYMAFYDEASAWAVFRSSDPFGPTPRTDYPIGRNRRNLYGGRVVRHLDALRDARRSARDWPTHDFSGDSAADWVRLKQSVGAVWGNGRFAVYTTAEMLQKVAGLPVVITDMDLAGSSGPADGTVRLYGLTDGDDNIEALARPAFDLVRSLGTAPAYCPLDYGVVESILCNFGGLCRGVFYSGRNLDRQMDRVLAVEARGEDLRDLWDARAAVFRRRDLGEFGGWRGVDRNRLLLFKKTGAVPWVYEGRSYRSTSASAGMYLPTAGSVGRSATSR